MTKRIENLKDFFIEQAREYYDISRQKVDFLPKLQKNTSNAKLRKLIDKEIKLSNSSLEKLQGALQQFNVQPQGETSECCKAELKHTEELMERTRNANVRDVVIVNSIQNLNHRMISGLGSLASYAKEIDQETVARSFHDTVESERKLDRELTSIAENEINKQAWMVEA